MADTDPMKPLVRIQPGREPGLYEELKSYDSRFRAQRLRELANIGLMFLEGRIGGGATGHPGAPPVRKVKDPGEEKEQKETPVKKEIDENTIKKAEEAKRLEKAKQFKNRFKLEY